MSIYVFQYEVTEGPNGAGVVSLAVKSQGCEKAWEMFNSSIAMTKKLFWTKGQKFEISNTILSGLVRDVVTEEMLTEGWDSLNKKLEQHDTNAVEELIKTV